MNTKYLLPLILLGLFSGCQQQETGPAPSTTKGLIKVSIIYPNGPDKTFDMSYYENKHMPMLAELYGDAMKNYTIDKGISGRTQEEEIPFLAMGCMYFETLADYRNGFAPNAEKILGDIPNYTNIQPIVQISEVVK